MIGTPVTGVETAWGEGQRPTSPATSLTSEGVQEIIVANNTRCASCPIAWPTRRPGSHDVPVMWLALSEFRYCRHNSCSVELCQRHPSQIHGNLAVCDRCFFIVLWNWLPCKFPPRGSQASTIPLRRCLCPHVRCGSWC